MAGLIPKKLSDLRQSSKNAIVTALIITKTNPKYFFVKKSMEFRGVITFTLRDTKTAICNCKYWGSKETVAEYNRKMKIGDVINVVCPLVLGHKFCSNEDVRFLPQTTLPIVLVVNEGNGSLVMNDYQDVEIVNRLQELMCISHKPLCDALRLSDVRFSYMAVGSVEGNNARTSRMPTQKVDLLVMVGQLRPTRLIRRSSNDMQCLEVIVFDESTPEGMLLTIWQIEWIQRAQQYWQPMKTTLHLIDIDIVDSSYHKCCTLRKSTQTVIYENPIGKEDSLLRQFAAMAPSKDFTIVCQSRSVDILPDPATITTQMTVRQIYMRLEGYLIDESEDFTAVLYAMITKFDIDGFGTMVSRRCKSCQKILSSRLMVCESDNCQYSYSLNNTSDRFELIYNINVHLSDHTGTLVETRLTGKVAEKIFGIPAMDFENQYQQNEKGLEDLKWRYLLQHFETKLLIKKPINGRRQAAILVVDMQPINSLEIIANRIMVF